MHPHYLWKYRWTDEICADHWQQQVRRSEARPAQDARCRFPGAGERTGRQSDRQLRRGHIPDQPEGDPRPPRHQRVSDPQKA